MEKLLINFKIAINLGKYQFIDESLVTFKGRLAFKQYNGKKRARLGVKLFDMVETDTQFVVDILPYQGKATAIADPTLIGDFGFGGTAVMT